MEDLARCGLCVLSLEPARWLGGLRSSSERERLKDRGCGAALLLLLLLLLLRCVLLVAAAMIDGLVSNDPQEGTGGRFRLGDDMAIFLLGCGGLGALEE
jgi:hypothetical protein